MPFWRSVCAVASADGGTGDRPAGRSDFFFQAEDGIRDLYVTGVQTCALPIYRFGNPVIPREWFLVPLFVIDDAVEKIKDGTITGYVYDPASAGLVKHGALSQPH